MEKWELAYKDRQQGMKYKEIAEKYGVSINTVKAWKSRKWNKQDQASDPPPKKVAHKKEKGCTQKKLQPVIDNDELTEQQKMFCLFYLQHFNATKAYQQAYQCDYKVANSNAYLLMVNHGIKAELHRLKAELQKDIFVDVKDLIVEYVKQFSADITDIVEVELTEYEVRDKAGNKVKTKDGEQVIGRLNDVYVRSSKDFDGSLVKKISQGKDGISVEMYDKQKAMNELMKYLGGDRLREAQISKAQQSSDVSETTEDKLDELMNKISGELDGAN
ncbi:terminase small subunit [Enterococcus avium]|uniref:Terminase n=1 Tax=Enterococcus avium TaxID=33945 RepID=A0A437UJ33_ENTAV|nr:terminase small subunit [Enterococcus avium]MDY4024811.1 terminase small subunit [Enterococcus avium]RVU93653.1 terminase [Enterococcus avium]